MLRKALLFGGLAAVAGYLLIDVAGAEMTPGYSRFSHTISEMIARGAVSKAALDPWYVLLNAMVVGFASALPSSVCRPCDGVTQDIRRGGAFLALAGILGILMTLWFPMDGSILRTTIVGTFHQLMAGAIVLCSMLAILLFGLGFRSNPGWEGFAYYSFTTFAFALACSVVTVRSIAVGDVLQGAWQRVTAATIAQWIFLVALKALSAPTG